MIVMTPRQSAILAAIPLGAENAQTGETIWRKVTGKSWSERARRALSYDVEALWAEGYVVCSTKAEKPKGYWLPTSPGELERYIAQSKAQARKEEERIRMAEAALKAMKSPAQPSLFREGEAA